MQRSELIAQWALDNPAMARGRLLTATHYIATALHELDRVIGYLDSKEPEKQYLTLGMDIVQRHLLHAVAAMDLVEAEPPPVASPRKWTSADDLPGHVNAHGAYICGPCTVGQHLGVRHSGSRHALCQCSCDGLHDRKGQLKKQRK